VESPLLAEEILTLSLRRVAHLRVWFCKAGSFTFLSLLLRFYPQLLSVDCEPHLTLTFPHISTALTNPSFPTQLLLPARLPPLPFESAVLIRMTY
jgi:hypothetical protein